MFPKESRPEKKGKEKKMEEIFFPFLEGKEPNLSDLLEGSV